MINLTEREKEYLLHGESWLLRKNKQTAGTILIKIKRFLVKQGEISPDTKQEVKNGKTNNQ